jgi:hypothetical protein
MNSLDALKALKDKLRKETQDVVGSNKYVKRSVIEEAKLKRLRAEEEQERQEKVNSTCSLPWAGTQLGCTCPDIAAHMQEKKRKLQDSARYKPLERTVSTTSSQELVRAFLWVAARRAYHLVSS